MTDISEFGVTATVAPEGFELRPVDAVARITALIAVLADAPGSVSRDLNMEIGKLLGDIPEDAHWGDGAAEETADERMLARFVKTYGETWTTPAHERYRQAHRDFIASNPSTEEVRPWFDANTPDFSKRPYISGNVLHYVSDVSAAMGLIPEEYRGRFTLLGQNGGWEARVARHVASYYYDFFVGIAERPAVAICIAALLARKHLLSPPDAPDSRRTG